VREVLDSRASKFTGQKDIYFATLRVDELVIMPEVKATKPQPIIKRVQVLMRPHIIEDELVCYYRGVFDKPVTMRSGETLEVEMTYVQED